MKNVDTNCRLQRPEQQWSLAIWSIAISPIRRLGLEAHQEVNHIRIIFLCMASEGDIVTHNVVDNGTFTESTHLWQSPSAQYNASNQ